MMADLRASEGVRAGIGIVLAPSGHQLDTFIATVGTLVAGPFAEIPEDCREVAMRCNVLTRVWACRAALPRMRGREGANSILIGSDQDSQPDVGLLPYAQAKAPCMLSPGCWPASTDLRSASERRDGHIADAGGGEVDGKVESLARDEFQTDSVTAEQFELQRRDMSLAYLGEPEERAEAVLFLVQNGCCTGMMLNISGGNVRGV